MSYVILAKFLAKTYWDTWYVQKLGFEKLSKDLIFQH